MIKDILYALMAMSFTIVIGGAVYEHIAVVPAWSAAPPASLSMFQGTHGLKPGPFWMFIHPLTLLLFIITMFVHWRTARKKPVAITLVGYIVILAITSVYFVPELMAIVNTPYASTVDAELTKRAQLWETLSIVRMVVLIVLAVVLFMGLTKSKERQVA